MPEKSIGVSDSRKILLRSAWLFFYEVWEVHWSAWFQENSWSPGSALRVLDFSTKSEKCVGVRDLGEILEVFGVRWECVISSTKSEKCVGSAWFQENAWSPRSALEVRSALLLRWWECVKVRWSALPMTGVREKCALQRTSVQQGEAYFMYMYKNYWPVTIFYFTNLVLQTCLL